jgi:rSAM/selenodomain-associated transferase 1
VETRCLVVFSKPALPGRVKTRLIGDLSPERAAALQAALLEDVRQAFAGAPFSCWLAWALEDDEPLPPGPEPALRQAGADLGERLYRGLAAAAREHQQVAAVGTDHPGLDTALVAQAFERLAAAELAIVPAVDGGYSLLAVRSAALTPDLFSGIAWSTPGVLAETRERAARLGLRVELLDAAGDLDTPADLARLCARLAAGEAASGPRTRRLLESWGRVPVVPSS